MGIVGVVDTGARKYKIGFDKGAVKRVRAFEGERTTHVALIMGVRLSEVRRVPLTYVCRQADTHLQPLVRSS